MTAAPLLSVRNLTVEFQTPSGPVTAVRNLSVDMAHGSTLAVVGESGSGKSTFAAAINRLLPENGRIRSGEILFDGEDLATVGEARMLQLRGTGIGLVPQDPMTNLNPIQCVGTQIAEAFEVHNRARGAAAVKLAVELLDMVGIPDPARRARQYPHELSGGMRQRVLIAMGLACRPRLLIADEPTSALDVTVQRVILDEIETLTRQFGTALLLITHDLELAAERADQILVMYRGDVVEAGPADRVLTSPTHEYTRRLSAAAPRLNATPLVSAVPMIAPDVPPGVAHKPLAEFVNVSKVYPGRQRWFGREPGFTAVAGTSLTIGRGETVAIVGESGSGKSTTARLLLKIEEPTSGHILFDGQEVTSLSPSRLHAFRRRVQPVFQNPFGSLDSRYTVARSIEEPMILHGFDAARRKARVSELMDQVALPASMADRLPAEISGGQSQRVAIARALALSPELVVLDEAVSALDVVVQAQILELLTNLQKELGLSYLFISHDLAVVRLVSHRVHVMKAGHIVESGAPAEIFTAPQTPYTRQLLAAIPDRLRGRHGRSRSLQGVPSSTRPRVVAER